MPDPLAWLRGKGRAENTVPPAEVGAHARAAAEAEQRIRGLDAEIYRTHKLGRRAERDGLLDERLAIRPPRPAVRPSVPVVPGGGS